MSTAQAPSLEPYLRARAVDPSLIPSDAPRTARRKSKPSADHDDFTDFLTNLLQLALSPVTVPLKLIRDALTSPLTVSLVLRLILLGVLVLSSAVFSILAVGAFWWSWRSGRAFEVEGWLKYGSRAHRTPHALISLAGANIQEDMRYDVQVEMELVRPSRNSPEMGNFMLSLELRSLRDTETILISASQPSLPPPPLPSSLLYIPSLPTYLLPPCFLPWPFRPLCPSRLLGCGQSSKLRDRRNRAGFSSPARGKDVVLLRKELMEGVVMKSTRGGESTAGAVFVSIGREDSFEEISSDRSPNDQLREVRTTGWVIVRFIPRPTGVRWLLLSHPLPPLLLLPPVSLTLTLSSSLLAFLLITYFARSRNTIEASGKQTIGSGSIAPKDPMSEEALLAEKNQNAFAAKDADDKLEAERRKAEWEEVQSSAMGGMRKMPESMKRRPESIIGGSETTAPSAVRSLGSFPDDITEASSEQDADGDETESTTTEVVENQ